MPTQNPTIHEHTARTRKAILLAEVLQALDCGADAAAFLSDHGWRTAAEAAEVPVPSTTTRAAVIAILQDRALHADPFASFARSPR